MYLKVTNLFKTIFIQKILTKIWLGKCRSAISNETSLCGAKREFHLMSPMYEEYWISNEVAKIIEPYLCEKLDINNYDYFLSCEEDII